MITTMSHAEDVIAMERVLAERDRLKAEVKLLRDASESLGDKIVTALSEANKLKSEVAHLRAAVLFPNTVGQVAVQEIERAENYRLRELIQEVIEHDETTGWGQNKLTAALRTNEPETKTVAVPAGEGYEAPIAGIAQMIHQLESLDPEAKPK